MGMDCMIGQRVQRRSRQTIKSKAVSIVKWHITLTPMTNLWKVKYHIKHRDPKDPKERRCLN